MTGQWVGYADDQIIDFIDFTGAHRSPTNKLVAGSASHRANAPTGMSVWSDPADTITLVPRVIESEDWEAGRSSKGMRSSIHSLDYRRYDSVRMWSPSHHQIYRNILGGWPGGTPPAPSHQRPWLRATTPHAAPTLAHRCVI